MCNLFTLLTLGVTTRIVLLFGIISKGGCVHLQAIFLQDFFAMKSVTVTINSCWILGQKRSLLQEFATEHQVGFLKHTLEKVSTSERWSNNDYWVLDLINCENSKLLLTALNYSRTFDFPVKYLLLVDREEFNGTVNTLSKYEILPNSDLTVAVFKIESAILYQPHKVAKDRELIWQIYGNWSLVDGLHVESSTLTGRRMNLKGANLVAGVLMNNKDTINHLTDYRYVGVDPYLKQDYEPMSCVLKYLNVNYSLNIKEVQGHLNATSGRFDGLVGEVEMGRADFTISALHFTEERFAVIDFIKYGTSPPVRFVLKKPSTSFVKNIYFVTFTKEVWFACMIILAICVVFSKIIFGWETKNNEEAKQHKYSLSDGSLLVLEAVCQQGTDTEPRSLSGRILAFLLFIIFMFMYVSYSANIVVLLQSSTTFTNHRSLLESKYSVGGENTSYMKTFFEEVKSGPLKELYDRKIYPDQYFSLEVGMKKIRDGGFAFHVPLHSAYDYISKELTSYEVCGLQELPGYVESHVGYTCLPKRSPYKDLLKVAILKIDELGLLKRTISRVLIRPQCYSQIAAFKNVDLYDCKQVFYIWIFLVISAWSVFLVEIAISRYVKFTSGRKRSTFTLF